MILSSLWWENKESDTLNIIDAFLDNKIQFKYQIKEKENHVFFNIFKSPLLFWIIISFHINVLLLLLYYLNKHGFKFSFNLFYFLTTTIVEMICQNREKKMVYYNKFQKWKKY